MDYLSYIGDLTEDPVLDLLMGLVGLILVSGLFVLIQAALCKAFCARMTDIEVFGFKYSRNRSGKWEKRGHRVKIGFAATSAIDFEHYPNVDSEKLIAMDKNHMLLTGILTLIIGIGTFAGCLIATFKIYYAFPAAVVLLTGFWVLIFAIYKFIVCVVAAARVSSKNCLGSYTNRALALLRSGVPFEKLDLKPVNDLNFPRVWESERKMYFPFYFQYLDAKGLYDQMPDAVEDVERIMNAVTAAKIDIGIYMDLVYYYSYHRPIPQKAKEYYHRIISDIEKDTDPNAYRIRGFYELNCFGNPDRAREYAIKALEGLETFSLPAEREYERMCIAKLNNAIDNFQHV